MYRNFFGFSKYPFCNTPDPCFFFECQNHTQAITFLLKAISEKRGVAAIVGESGSGKTFISRKLFNQLEENIEVGWIPNTCLRDDDFLKAICEEFKLPTQNKTEAGLLSSLNDFLEEGTSKKKKAVLIVDEAHNLSLLSLEKILKLTNLESEKEKRLQIILLGQTELKNLFEKTRYEQLKQQGNSVFQLKPLNLLECIDYIKYRLHIAGSRFPELFDQPALELIYKASKGVPRKINNICDNALLNGFVESSTQLNVQIIDKVIRDNGFQETGQEFSKKSIHSTSLNLVLASLIVVLGMVQFFKQEPPPNKPQRKKV